MTLLVDNNQSFSMNIFENQNCFIKASFKDCDIIPINNSNILENKWSFVADKINFFISISISNIQIMYFKHSN